MSRDAPFSVQANVAHNGARGGGKHLDGGVKVIAFPPDVQELK